MVKKTLSPETVNFDESLWGVFSDETDLRILKPLKRGFRHCFILMHQDARWLLVDPRSNKTDVMLLPHPAHFNMPRYFLDKGMTVLKTTPYPEKRKIAPLLPISCVETVKRLIGLHHWLILTPYHLYRHLLEKQQKQKGSIHG